MNASGLGVGSYGEAVSQLQQGLRQGGYDIATAEIGRQFLGPSTRDAIMRYQRDHALSPSGYADPDTLLSLAAGAGPGNRVPPGAGPAPGPGPGGHLASTPAGRYSPSAAGGGRPVGSATGPRTAAFPAADPVGFRVGGARPPLAPTPSPSLESPSLDEAATASGLTLPAGLRDFLQRRGVGTLVDVLTAGGLAELAGLPVPADDPALRMLHAQASLSTLVPDPRVSASLIRSGYDSPRAIADTPAAQFVASVASTVANAAAAAVHARATAQTALLDNILAGHLAGQASGQGPSPLDEQIPPELCQCADCEAAVSPLAYLVSLLDFALTRITGAGAPTTVPQLEATYHQPFGRLIASCSAVTTSVRQVRICIEVLRSLRGGQPAPGDADYRTGAYRNLLRKIGTSYDELRLARAADPATRQALAERLGLGLTGAPHLDELLFDLSAGHPSEAELETVFGLVDTTRDPLAAGPAPNLLTWRQASLRAAWATQDRPTAPRPSRLVIDPDLIDSRDFRDPVPGDPAYALWKARAAALAHQDQGWRTTVNKQPANVDLALTGALGLTGDGLLALADQYKKGIDIGAQLALAHLDIAGFNRLVTLIRLQRGGLAVLDADWDEFFNILSQAWKTAQTPTWVGEEATHTITLSPDFFAIPTVPVSLTAPPAPPFPITVWRASAAARADWQDTLQSRIDQYQGLADALQIVVDGCEETTLPGLRDALLATTDAPDPDLAAKTAWFSKKFFLDAAVGGCEKTTRVAQAIDTIQGLLFAARTGEAGTLAIADQYVAQFDEEWAWMGSYAMWRAAVFVFLYPENLLLPSLRRADQQTPLFRSIVHDVRANRHLTAQTACEQARRYAGYLRDLCNLTVEATCLAPTRIHHGTCRDQRTEPEDRPLVYIFARSPAGTVYWSSYEMGPPFWVQTPNGQILNQPWAEQAFWDPVPGIGPAVQVIGASYYTPDATQHRLLVFLKTMDKSAEKLHMVSYDLLTQSWLGDPVDLELPLGTGTFGAAVAQRLFDPDIPVRLVIYQTAPSGTTIDTVDRSSQGLLYTRLVNSDATNWESREPRLILGDSSINDVHALVSYDSHAPFVFGDYVFFHAYDDVHVGIFFGGDESSWITSLADTSSLGPGAWVGDVAFPSGGAVFPFVRRPGYAGTAYGNIARGPRIGTGPIPLTHTAHFYVYSIAPHSGYWDTSVLGSTEVAFAAYQDRFIFG